MTAGNTARMRRLYRAIRRVRGRAATNLIARNTRARKARRSIALRAMQKASRRANRG